MIKDEVVRASRRVHLRVMEGRFALHCQLWIHVSKPGQSCELTVVRISVLVIIYTDQLNGSRLLFKEFLHPIPPPGWVGAMGGQEV